MIIGDSQILGQVKEAFEISEDLDFAGTALRRIFDTAIKTGKRAIKETTIVKELLLLVMQPFRL